MKRKAWGSRFGAPGPPEAHSGGPGAPKKLPQALRFIGFSQSQQVCAIRFQKAPIWAYYSRSKLIFQKIKQCMKKGSLSQLYSCSKSISQEIYFSPKGFSIWQLYSNAKSIKFILRKHHKSFSIWKGNKHSTLILFF